MFPLYERDAAIAGAPGCYVTLDAAARKEFYLRTRAPCPVCGKNGDSKPSIVTTARGLTCSECGRPQPAPPPAMGDFQTAGHLPFDDLDDLVDGLDRRMQQRG